MIRPHQHPGLPIVGAVPPSWLVLAGIVSVQIGAAVAKGLFDEVPPTVVVWLRLATSAVVLLFFVRRWPRGLGVRGWLPALGLGVSLCTMNWAIYQSFARIPLGMAVTIEFLGPLAVAIAGSRRPRDLIWAGLAALGVAVLGFSPSQPSWTGIGFALVAGMGWAAYILLTARTGQVWPGVSGLVVASAIGTAVLGPPAVALGGHALLDPHVVVLGIVVGLLSSAVPYSLEMVALRRIPARIFGILMSLEPGVAAVAALVLLGEVLTPGQWFAIACVVVASVGATRTDRDPPLTVG